MACEFCDICRRPFALQRIRKELDFSMEDYPSAELIQDVCLDDDATVREKDCPAYQDLSANGRASSWAK